jgi:RNA polymerase sigma-70 factor (ECF subfamily)
MAQIDWAEVYRTTYHELVRYLHRKVWDEDRAQDLAQEAFLRGLDRQPANPRAWLFHVASNLARDEARLVIRRKRHLTLLRGNAEAAGSSVPPASVEVEKNQEAERVRRALEQLSPRDQDILLLWDAGLSYTEIATQLDLAAGAVGTTLARARHRLVDAFNALEGKHAAHS